MNQTTISFVLEVLPKETGWLIAGVVAMFITVFFLLIWFLVRQR